MENSESSNDRDTDPNGSGSWPSYAPADPSWVTEDFSSLDLGADSTEPSSRPVRRLDLPPLSQLEGEQMSTGPGGGPGPNGPNGGPPSGNRRGSERRPNGVAQTPAPPAASDAVRAGMVSDGAIPERRVARAGAPVPEPPTELDFSAGRGAADTDVNDLGVFGAADDATAVFASDNGPDADRMGGQPPSGPSYGPSMSAPKQGAPPHPLSGAGGAPTRGRVERGQLRSVAPTGGGGGFDDPGFGQPGRGDGFGAQGDDNFGAPEDWPDDPSGSSRFEGRRSRSQLELAPPIEVEQERRRWALPVAGLAALLALAAGYFFFIRDDGGDADEFAVETDTSGDLVEEDLEPDGATADPDDAMGDGTDGSTDGAPAVLSGSPVLTLQGADDGPLETETQYELQIEGVPANSEYLVIVDDIPQEPALDYLPLLILPEGRHSIAVEVRSGADSATSNFVDVYVLTPQLTKTYRANLSSVSMTDEGWSEALRQFDEFRAAGHDGLVLSPSDPYQSLLPGFWNLYVGGFANHAEAQAYCEQAGLIIPDECFPAPFDPDGPPRDG